MKRVKKSGAEKAMGLGGRETRQSPILTGKQAQM